MRGRMRPHIWMSVEGACAYLILSSLSLASCHKKNRVCMAKKKSSKRTHLNNSHPTVIKPWETRSTSHWQQKISAKAMSPRSSHSDFAAQKKCPPRQLTAATCAIALWTWLRSTWTIFDLATTKMNVHRRHLFAPSM